MREAVTIGRLARSAGVNVETIRYYQRRGLIDEPPKPPGGQRKYPAADVTRLSFIRRAQQLGFSLEEVKNLLALADSRNHGKVHAIAETKRAALDRHIAHLTGMRRRLVALIKKGKRAKRGAVNPLIAALLAAD